MDDSKDYFDNLAENINSLVSENTKDENLRLISLNNATYVQGLGTFSKDALGYVAYKSKDSTINQFYKIVADKLGIPIDRFTDTKKMYALRLYNHFQNRAKTNRAKASINERTYYTIEIDEEGEMTLKRKGVKSYGVSNLEYVRRRLVENDTNIEDIFWIHGEDIKIKVQKEGVPDKTFIAYLSFSPLLRINTIFFFLKAF